MQLQKLIFKRKQRLPPINYASYFVAGSSEVSIKTIKDGQWSLDKAFKRGYPYPVILSIMSSKRTKGYKTERQSRQQFLCIGDNQQDKSKNMSLYPFFLLWQRPLNHSLQFARLLPTSPIFLFSAVTENLAQHMLIHNIPDGLQQNVVMCLSSGQQDGS